MTSPHPTMRTIFASHMGGIVITHIFSNGWQLNLAMHLGSVGHDAGLFETMILVPEPTPAQPGRVRTASPRPATYGTVEMLIEKCKNGDASVFEK